MDVLDAIAAHAASEPSRPAHRWQGGELEWGDLWHQSGSLAGRLVAELPDDHSPVLVLAHKQSLALVAMLACVRAGHPFVPVDDSVAPGRLADILAVAAASALLAVSPTPEIPLPTGCLHWDADAVTAAAHTSAPAPDHGRATHGAQAWYVIFTSGSTGEPKGVQISADNLSSFLDWVVGLVPDTATRHHAFLNQAPWSFDLSVMDTWTSLVTGATLVSIDRDEVAHPSRLVAALRASEATVWVSTPSFAGLCLSYPGFDSSLVPVETFLFCGETLPPATASALLDRFPGARVHNTYGPTEATVAVTGLEVTREVIAHHPVLPVGRPKPGCAITIRTPEGGLVPPGGTGEIWIHGDTVSAGYLGRPDLTARAFAPATPGLRHALDLPSWPTYRTGDAGRLDDDLLFFAGRLDHQVKLHGYRIELGDIEANLNRLPEVAACVVLPRSEGGVVDHLEAVVQLADAGSPRTLVTTLALRRSLGDLLPAYMVPKTFRYLDELPMTTNGKVDRQALAGG